jgi:aminodeoxyfutalosine synthase
MSHNFNFKYLKEKVDNNDRLSFDDGCEILRSADLSDIQKAADYAREKNAGDQVYYIVNKHIYYSNICSWQCKFCAFSKNMRDPGAYAKSPVQILTEINKTPFISEVRITGGVNPRLGVEYFCSVFSLIKEKHPDIHIEALAPTEIDFIARCSYLSAKETLLKFKEAGLGSLAAGGAEIASERVRNLLYPKKSPFTRWLEVSRTAHELGIMSNASILYGHIETIEERVAHLVRIRALQDETGGFNAFIPLKYIEKKGSGIKSSISGVSEDLKMYALSRLFLDNFKHIKILWLFNGSETARSALKFGANDIGGTVYECQKGVARSAGSSAKEHFSKDDMVKLILDAGREPFERGTLYQGKAHEC